MMINHTNSSELPSSGTTGGAAMTEHFLVEIHGYLARMG